MKERENIKKPVDNRQHKEYNQNNKPAYKIHEIQSRINSGKYQIRQNARDSASDNFGWNDADICNAFLEIKEKHFYKSEPSKNCPEIMLDFYKGVLKGNRIYTHFYINEDNVLVINSFKKE